MKPLHKQTKTPEQLNARTGEPNGNEDITATLNAAYSWIELNPELWAELSAWAVNEAEHEWRFAVAEYLQSIRWHDRVNAIGEGVKVNNNHEPIFARLLVNKHPNIRPFIQLRKSKFDRVLNAE